MKRAVLFLAAIAVSGCAVKKDIVVPGAKQLQMEQINTYYIPDEITHKEPGKMQDRLKSCRNMGEIFSKYIAGYGKDNKMEFIRTKAESLAEHPNRIEINFDWAKSYGQMMIFHYKAANVNVVVYQNGEKVRESQFHRGSTGGFAGGAFRSSCSVMNRVNKKLASDIARWIKSEQVNAVNNTDTAAIESTEIIK